MKEDEIKREDIIALMNTYLTEWIHRDNLLWMHVFKIFYATILVIFLPHITNYLNIDLPQINPLWFYIMSLVFLYISLGYSKRLEASGKTYQNIIELLDDDLQRIKLKSEKIKFGRFFSIRMSVLFCSILFFALTGVSIIMIISTF